MIEEGFAVSELVTSTVIAMSACLLVAGAATAAASPQAPTSSVQDRAAQAPQAGSLVVEPINNGFVIIPEVKFTKISEKNKLLVGAYGGWLLNETFLLGAGGYWLADRKSSDGSRMGYGGFVAGWTAPLGSAVRVGARGLFGMGQARLTADVTYCNSDCFGWDHMHGGPPSSGFTGVRRVIFDQHFIVFEPQATAVIRLGSKVALDMGGGYRVIGAADGLEKQLRGPFGSVGVRFGPF